MSPLLRTTVALVFFLSGFAALIYQVAWQRMLVVFAGGDVLSVTLIVTAFMAGLGLGHMAGGALADRRSRMASLAMFAATGVLIAIFGFASKWLLYDLLYLQWGHLAGSRAVTFLVLLACLIMPTFLMGMSLPLLARATVRGLKDAPATIGRLYGVNTLGAALGALGATWALMPNVGMEGSLLIAGALSLVCATAILPAVFGLRRAAEEVDRPEPPVAETAAGGAPRKPLGMGAWFAIYACSGFIALSMEIVWFRMLGVMQKPTAFSFGTLLAVYLAGVGIGSLAGLRMASRSRRPAATFFLLQGSIGLYVGLVTSFIVAAVDRLNSFSALRAYFDSYDPMDVNAAFAALGRFFQGAASPEELNLAGLFAALYVGLPLLLVGPPTLLMGLSFPFLQRAVQTDLARVGRRVGWLQTANILGCMVGAMLTGIAALAMLGSALTLRILVAGCAPFGLAGIRRAVAPTRPRLATALQVVLAVVVVGIVWLMPSRELLWARTHGTTPGRLIVAESGSGVSVIKPEPDGRTVLVFVNGIGQSYIPYGGVHTAIGVLPLMLHPNPVDIAVIGLGSGDTLFSLGGRPETRRLVCIEIIGPQLETLRELALTDPDPALRSMLDDPRIEHITGDGRLYLMHSPERFDIIEADALRPSSAHSGNLYSDTYFELLLSRLKPGGFAVTWCPTPRVVETFISVFPHAIIWGSIGIGSNEPIPLDPAVFDQRISTPSIQDYYGLAGIDLLELLEPYFDPEARFVVLDPGFDRSTLTDINTDLFPKDEFALPALWKRR